MNEAPAQLQIPITGELAAAAVAWGSLAHDIETVGTYLEELRTRWPQPGSSDPLPTSLWWSAVIRYGRCFGTGRRKGYINRIRIPSWFGDRHKWLIAKRRESIAHLGGDPSTEQSIIVAKVFEGPGDLIAVFRLSAMMGLPTVDDVADTQKLVAWLRQELTMLEDGARNRILEILRTEPYDRLRQAARDHKGITIGETFPPTGWSHRGE